MLYNQDWEKPTETPMSKLLNTAADQIETHGHTKKELYGSNGSMCFMGAIHKARAIVAASGIVFGHQREIVDHILKAMDMEVVSYPNIDMGGDYRLLPDPVMTIVDWNNAPERTAREVIDAFRLAAKVPVA